MAAPLTPFTVLEIADPEATDMHHIALGLAGRIVADMGATVFRVLPAGGDPLRSMPVEPWEDLQSPPRALAGVLNASKVLTASTPDDAFLAGVDAVLTTGEYLPDPDFERITVRLRDMSESHPLKSAEAPSIGELGLLALSGVLDIVGDPEREPLALAGHQAAYAAGLACFAAMMTGLAGRSLHSGGDAFDVDMLDVLTWVNWKAVAAHDFTPGSTVSREGDDAAWRVIRAADGYVALVFARRDWRRLAELIDHAALADPALEDAAIRESRRDDYMPHIEAWAASRTREEIYRAAQARRIPIGPVVEPGELLSDPHIQARGMISQLASGRGSGLTLPRIPAIWNDMPFQPRAPMREDVGR